MKAILPSNINNLKFRALKRKNIFGFSIAFIEKRY